MRCLHEIGYWKESVFLTLTYSNENIPEGGTLIKYHLQQFFKEIRKDIYPNKIKYLACGEYGDMFSRPHYHAIVFGLSPNNKIITERWIYGFVKSGSVTYKSARYVAGYIEKKYNGLKAKSVYGERQIPFQLQSKGIGKKWAEENQTNLINNLSLTVDGIRHSMPRYYRKILGDKITDESLLMRKIQKVNELDEYMQKRGISRLSEQKLKDDLNKKHELELEQKIQRYKKRQF
nr:MAG: replication initiator protein [Microviridae sp.]